MVAWEDVEDWWSDRSALFTFDPGALQELLNERRTPYELRLDHAAVAKALEELIADDDPPPRHALLEIARHYEAAREPLDAATAARRRRRVDVHGRRLPRGVRPRGARRRPAARGAAEAARADAGHAAPARARAPLPDPRRGDGLACGGYRARTAPASSRSPRRQCVPPTRPATRRCARTRAMRPASSSPRTGASTMRSPRTRRRSRSRGRRATRSDEFAILLKLGHQLDSVDLKRGRDTLEEAHELLTSGALDEHVDASRRAFEEARLDMSIGVAEFDLGHFGAAQELLVRSAQPLRERGRGDDLAWSLAFLAQLYIAIGLYEAAEATLRDAVALFGEPPRGARHPRLPEGAPRPPLSRVGEAGRGARAARWPAGTRRTSRGSAA